jgi:hypothetical protein
VGESACTFGRAAERAYPPGVEREKPRLHAGRVILMAVLTALGLTVAGSILALGVGLLMDDPAGGAPVWAFLACDLVLIVVCLILVSGRDRPQAMAPAESHACGSCGRSFSSRQQLFDHRERVHAPGLTVLHS